MSPTSKPAMLLSQSRSGSTPIYQLILDALKSRGPMEGLGEYFNPRHDRYSLDSDGHIRIANEVQHSISMEKVRAEQKNRLQLLQNAKGTYFFKTLVDFWNPVIAPWLSEHYDWIFLERRNIYRQLISYLEARCTDIWYRDQANRNFKWDLIANPSAFADFEKLHELYQQLKFFYSTHRQVRPTIYYEDFCELGPQKFLNQAGFELGSNFKIEKDLASMKQGDLDKKTLFKNWQEIDSWCKASNLPYKIENF